LRHAELEESRAMTNLDESSWSIVARNLPAHANNPIHTDSGAQAAGFPRALVAGVTTYAYCLTPIIDALGEKWISRGQSEVRFRSPVFDGDNLRLPMTRSSFPSSAEQLGVVAYATRENHPLVVVSAAMTHDSKAYPTNLSTPERLTTVEVDLIGEYGADYAAEAGVAHEFCAQHRYVHPAVWPALANYVFHRQLARGSWIHTRSVVRHFAAVAHGATATVETSVIARIFGRDERVVANVTIVVAGTVVATVEHEAIIDLAERE
jgi:acyl dehydratase